MDGINTAQVVTADPKKKKSGVGLSIIGTLASVAIGDAIGQVLSDATFDTFKKISKAAIDNPATIKAELLKNSNSKLISDEFIESYVERAVSAHKKNLAVLKKIKNKWVVGSAIAGGLLFLGCKALFHKNDKT